MIGITPKKLFIAQILDLEELQRNLFKNLEEAYKAGYLPLVTERNMIVSCFIIEII